MQGTINNVSLEIEQSTTRIYQSYEEMFDRIAEKYDSIIGVFESKQGISEAKIEKSYYRTNVNKLNNNEYNNIIDDEKSKYKQLKNKRNKQQSALDEAVAGGLEVGSVKWNEMQAEINNTTAEMEQSATRISQTYVDMFDQVGAKYDGVLQGFEHTESMLGEYIAQAEAQGHIVSTKYYEELIKNENSTIDTLKKKQADLVAARDAAVDSGKIKKGSQAWYDMCAEIDGVTQEIESSNTAILEWQKSIRDIEWETFDLAQEKISNLNDEAEFFVELMSNKKLHNDDGTLTDEGRATMGMYGQQYNTHMRLADNYGVEAARLTQEIEKDPYNQDLINRRDEMLKLQRDSILAAESEKNAIKDLVEEGINLELDALQERIDKQNESLQSEKDLYDYQKKVKDQTKEIASLEKQMAAYSSDDSEESRQKVQQIKMELETAKEDLKETEYDKYISDQSALLDSLYTEYEDIINQRLDNVDALLSEAITSINDNAGVIAQTLYESADKVGYSMSEDMDGIWSEAKTAADTENQRRVEQTQAVVDQLVANGTLSQEDANNIIAGLSLGNQQQAIDALVSLQELVADGKLSQKDYDNMVSALVTGNADEITNANNTIGQLVANGTLASSDADKIISAINGAKPEGDKIVGEYDKNENGDTKVNKAVDNIQAKVDKANKNSETTAQTNINKNKTNSSSEGNLSKNGTNGNKTNSNKNNNKTNNKTNGNKTNTNNNKTNNNKTNQSNSSGDGKAKVGDKVKFVSGNYYYDSEGTSPLGHHNRGKQVYITKINTKSWATHPYHISTGKKLGKGDLGWLKLSQLSGYASGKKKISNNEYAWTQENGQEYIVRPSDGAILTPVAKGDSVLNATASGNIWSMANNPAEFIRDNLKLDASNVPNGSNVQSNYTQHFENVNFNMPNVHSYNELISEMQRDPKFEKLILAMTLDQLAGGSKLAKGKAIR